jgi:tRNA nucleotidyltransferase (CCA-adding enzyme)
MLLSSDETDCPVGTAVQVMNRPNAPRGVRRIIERLEKAGYEAWGVGGAIRDALLGHDDLDWDVATSARPADVQRLFRRTVPVGVEFGTVGVLDDAGVMHEVTTFRRDVHTDGRHAVVEFGASLDDDLARRDFTINAIAYSPTTGEIRDPFGGKADLERRLVRAVGDPDERMREDRLRALRGIRFAARLGFTIEPATWSAIVQSAPHLTRLSRERVKQEIEKTVEQVIRPSEAFAMWRTSGALASLVPALDSQDAIAFSASDCIPLPGATRRGDRRDGRRTRRITSMFVGLPMARVRETTHDLRFSNTDVRSMTRLAEYWTALFDAISAAAQQPDPPTDGTIRRWAATIGRTQLAELMRLVVARWDAMRAVGDQAPSPQRANSLYRRALRVAYRDPVELADVAVDGEDLQREGIARGPVLGKILRSLLAWVVEEPTRNERDSLLAKARELAVELAGGAGEAGA